MKRFRNVRIIENLEPPVSGSGCSGFTLLELIVVIFIVSLVLAVSLPSFTGIGEGRMKSEAKRLASLVRYLNDSALSTKETLRMRITFNDKTIQYIGPEGEKAEQFDTLSGMELQSKGMISEGEVIFFFSPVGASENFTMHLKDNGSEITVDFNSLNGKVRIARGDDK